MLKFGIALSWIAFLTVTAASQQPALERGQPQELKGVTRVYVSSVSKDARNNIIGELKKRLPELTITEKAEEAEIWLLFSVEQRTYPKSDPASAVGSVGTAGTSPQYEVVAKGAVIKPLTKERARRLISFTEVADTAFSFPEYWLSTRFAKAFAKAYRKANP